MKENNNKIQSATAVILAVFVLAFSCAFFLMEKKEFSESENRYLSAFPEFSAETLKNGDFMEGGGSFSMQRYVYGA